MYQLLAVLKKNINPVLARHAFEGKLDEARSLVKKVRRGVYPAFIVVSVTIWLVFPLALDLLDIDPKFLESAPALGVLLFGMSVVCGLLPFDAVLLQSGMPGRQTTLIAVILTSNALLNVILIPFYGILGAAIATSTSYVVGGLYLAYAANRYLGIRLVC